jgi:hypothetical protein
MELIEILSQERIKELILNTKYRIYLSLPGIESDLAQFLSTLDHEVKISIAIDNTEETIRNGYGDLNALVILKNNNIKLYECAGNMVSFIISDSIGYFLFPQSKIFSNKPLGPNAFRIDPFTIHLLSQIYFSRYDQAPYNDIMFSIKHQEVSTYYEHTFYEMDYKETPLNTCTPLNEEKFNLIRENLENNPPLQPDLKRLINTYNAEIQFAELSFEGGNIHSKTIHYPKDALPVDSKELKMLLNSTMKVFGDLKDNPVFSKLNLLKFKVSNLRKKYLISIASRPGKSILKKFNKLNFENEMSNLNLEIEEVQAELPDLLKNEEEKTRQMIRKELLQYFKKKPLKEFKHLKDKIQREQKTEDYVELIVNRIDFPNLDKLVEKMVLRFHIYDLTWNDFSDEDLLKEFRTKKILASKNLDNIVELKEAYGTKKNR